MVRTAARPTTGAEVVVADDRHLETLTDFYRQTWDADADAERVRTARLQAAECNPVCPGDPPPTFLFLLGGRAIGHVGSIPVRVWGAAGVRPAHWVKGLMVLPEHRNGPVGFLLLKDAMRHLELAMAMVVQPEARRLFQALGFADVGVLPNALRVLHPSRVLRRLDSAGVGGMSPGSWGE